MFVLIYVTLLCSVTGSSADPGASGMTLPSCYNGFCISLSEGEITAEAGLCAVIQCSFTTAFDQITSGVWYKCNESKPRCSDSDIIFHSWNRFKVQDNFMGRVSLLNGNVYQRNCGIVIKDLDKSDSGSYQFRINGRVNQLYNGFTFTPRATVSVKALTQKPTVTVPPLTEGQQTTLTCTAPGLCPGSDPHITWTWRGAAENDSHITGSIATTQRRSSSLTFTPSAKHHGTEVTCEVIFTGDETTQETVTLNVSYVKEVKITPNMTVKEGDTLNLTCSVESFPPSLVMWQTVFDKSLQNVTEMNIQNDTDLLNGNETTIQTDTGSATVVISNVTAEHSGQYICTVEHLNNTVMETVDVKVIYTKNPVITGNRRVHRGDALNLTCSIDSFPPSVITWTKLDPNGTNVNLQNDTGSATLVVHNVTADNSGQYTCTGKHEDKTLTAYADVTVTWLPEILNSSGCSNQSGVLTCVCISHGFPLPTIRWPLLEKHTEYSGAYTVAKQTISSTITVPVKTHSSTAVQCVSTNLNGEVKENLTMETSTEQQDEPPQKLLKVISRVEVVIAFLIGVLMSTILCFFAQKCHRRKQKSASVLDETMEMMTSQEDPLVDAGQAVEDAQMQNQEAAEGRAGVMVKGAPDLNGEPNEVEYASIDFSVLKRRSHRTKREETTRTEYAEIKKEKKEELEENGGTQEEMSEYKEEEVTTGEDEDTKHRVPEEEEEEEEEDAAALYSNVKDVMGEI